MDLVNSEKIELNTVYDYYKNACLEELDDSEIIDRIGMGNMPEILFYLYEKYNHQIELIPIENNDVMIRVGDTFNAANMSYLAVEMHFIEISNDKVHLEGNISYPSVLGAEFEFLIKNGNKKYYPIMTRDDNDRKIDECSYERRDEFSVDIDLCDDNEIFFCNVVGSLECRYGKINSMRFVKVADNLENQYWYKDGYLITSRNGILKISKCDDYNHVLEKERCFQKEIMSLEPEKGEMICRLRQNYLVNIKKKKRPIWLFMDRANQADDNAEVLFSYIQDKSEIDSYFIIDENSKDYERLKEIGNVIPLYSEEHFEKVLIADYIISSQSNGVVENPFWGLSEYVRDLYHNPKIVFLQHGVIKDDMSPTLNRRETNFYGFVTSTYQEWKSIIEYPYHYKEENVWLTGLPRFDRLYHDEENVILVMPSWRKGLMEHVWDDQKKNMVWKINPEYKNSDFYKSYRKLFSSIWLHLFLCLKGYKMVFYPHPLLRDIAKEMVKGTKVECWMDEMSYRDAFAKAKLMITDYSSVAFDFAYLQKPILYYQFDKEEFFASHTYKKGYFDYEKDGFGEVCYQWKDLWKLIKKLVKKGCVNKYVDRISASYTYLDNNNCYRIYKKLVSK